MRPMPAWFRPCYTLLWALLLPWALLRLLLRSRRNPGYREHWAERLGLKPLQGPFDLMLHAVSVGEARAAAPLVRAWLDQGKRVLVTCTTPTGRATLEALFGGLVALTYLPFDLPWAQQRWLRHARPRQILLMETELWPGLIQAAAEQGMAVHLVNARMSEKSAARYARWGGLTRRLLGLLQGVAAQSEADAERLRRLGASAVIVTGNLKFDLQLPEDWPTQAQVMARHLAGGAVRPFWVAASTRVGEEALLLEALRAHRLRQQALAVIVPRHPERWDEVHRLALSLGFRTARRSDAAMALDTEVVIGDSMGEMLAYLGEAVAVVMGGTLAGTGGQNLIEPCALGVPVVLGPSTYNFAAVAEAALAAGAAQAVPDASAALDAVAAWLEHPTAREQAAQAALSLVAAHRGATARTLEWLNHDRST